VDDLPVEKGGAPGNRGEEPDNKEDLAFIVEGKPETKKEISDVLGQSENSKYYPVCHPMNIVLYKYFYKTSPSLIYENSNTGKANPAFEFSISIAFCREPIINPKDESLALGFWIWLLKKVWPHS
jgi:hypothetical protein